MRMALAIVGSVLGACGAAAAQELSPGEGEPRAQSATVPAAAPSSEPSLSFSRPEWTVQVEPMVWFVAPSGEVKLPDSRFQFASDPIRVERLNMDSPLLSPGGSVQIRADRWRFSFFGASYNSERNFAADSTFIIGEIAVVRGDDVEVDFDFFWAEATAGYRVYERDFFAQSGSPASGARANLDIHAFGGARVYDFGLSVRNKTDTVALGEDISTSTDQFFAEPVVGALFELELGGDFTISVQLSGGAMPLDGHSSYSVDVAAGFRWRPHPNVGVLIGWRQLAFWLSDGDDGAEWDEFEYEGRLAGVYGGVTIRF